MQVTPLRVATFNTYLISRRFNLNRETFPERRAARINHQLLSVSASVSAGGLPSSSSSSSSSTVSNNNTNDSNNTRIDGSHTTVRRSGTGSSLTRAIDLLFLQEVWGVGLSELTKKDVTEKSRGTSDRDALLYDQQQGLNTWYHYDAPPNRTSWTLGRYVPSRSVSSFVSEIIDTVYLHHHKTGGLYDFVLQRRTENGHGDQASVARTNMECTYRSKHTFTVSRSKSRKGVEATLWTIPQWDGSNDVDVDTSKENHAFHSRPYRHHLLVFNTHLDPTPSQVENRKQQIHEILHFMDTTLREIDNKRRRAGSSHTHHDWSRTAVLVVGDFNIKAGSKEYHDILTTTTKREDVCANDQNSTWWWSIRDLFWEDGETPDDDKYLHQHTYAVRNSLAVYPEDCGRIDYIFAVDEFGCPDKVLTPSTTTRTTTTTTTTATTTTMKAEVNHTDQNDDGRSSEGSIRPTSYKFMPLKVVSKQIRDEAFGEESSDHYALIVDLVPEE